MDDERANSVEEISGLEAAGSVMGRRARGLMALVAKHAGSVLSDRDSRSESAQDHAAGTARPVAPSEMTSPGSPGMSWRVKLLKWLPWAYGAGFILSFWWDFNGMGWTWTLPAGASEGWWPWQTALRIPLDGLLRIVCVGGMIGFLTNWLAITMLFRPSGKHPLLGHGLIPANKERIARRMAKSVSEDLINPELIKRKIHDSGWIRMARLQTVDTIRSVVDREAFREDLKAWVKDTLAELVSDPDVRADLASAFILRVEEMLQDRFLERFAYRTYQFLKGSDAQRIVEEVIAKVPEMVDGGLNRLDDLLDELPLRLERGGVEIEDWVTQVLFRMVNRLNVEELVLDNLIGYDERKVERMIKGATHEQLNYIQYLGALLGGIGGLVIWQPVLSLALMLVVGGAVYGLDFLILGWRGSKRAKSPLRPSKTGESPESTHP